MPRPLTIREMSDALRPPIREALEELFRNQLAMTHGLAWIEDSTIDAATQAVITALCANEPGPLLFHETLPATE